ncbi:MAG: hypothetical protein IJX36_03410 [Thermoguttaceae bacterium]|nr:hypothetical protein [Thermoguttaceae bacterium]MBQ8362962.1 hypothetical protein [Thermoguttaceae bacterium]MBQ9127579.1 hypothetical protein [Thermoguttaceae bacterium]
MLLSALISAFVLSCVIKGFTDEEVGMVKAFVVALLAVLVGSVAAAVATAPMTSTVARLCVGLSIHFVVAAVAVQVLCSTDVKTVLKIALTYFAIKIVFTLVLIFTAIGAVAAISSATS